MGQIFAQKQKLFDLNISSILNETSEGIDSGPGLLFKIKSRRTQRCCYLKTLNVWYIYLHLVNLGIYLHLVNLGKYTYQSHGSHGKGVAISAISSFFFRRFPLWLKQKPIQHNVFSDKKFGSSFQQYKIRSGRWPIPSMFAIVCLHLPYKSTKGRQNIYHTWMVWMMLFVAWSGWTWYFAHHWLVGLAACRSARHILENKKSSSNMIHTHTIHVRYIYLHFCMFSMAQYDKCR